jgi:thiol-disulfide isomerase/thioredoxin
MLNLAVAAAIQAAVLTGGEATYSEAYKLAKDSGKPLVVLVGADWCPACQTMKNSTMPELQQAGGLKNVAFAVVNYDRQTSLARRLMRGSSIPQLIMFHQTEKGWRRTSLIGSQSVASVESMIKQGIAETSVASVPATTDQVSQEK